MALSLLDRLTDLEPGQAREPPISSWEEDRILKASLCRDLTALLNTRRARQDFDPEFKEATNSVLSYGVADFSTFRSDLEMVRRSMERAIREFEPRLTKVTVTMEVPDPNKPLLPVLLFRISAIFGGNSDEEDVLFDASLRRESRRFSVTGSNI